MSSGRGRRAIDLLVLANFLSLNQRLRPFSYCAQLVVDLRYIINKSKWLSRNDSVFYVSKYSRDGSIIYHQK